MKTFAEEFAAIKSEIPNSRSYKAVKRLKEKLKDRKLVLYGPEDMTRMICNICDDLDQAYETPEVEVSPDTTVLICSRMHQETDRLMSSLMDSGFDSNQIFTWLNLYWPNKYDSLEGLSFDISGFRWVYGLAQNDITKRYASELLLEIKAEQNDRPIVLYGTGELGRETLMICRKIELEVDCFCDRKSQDSFMGIEVVTPEILADEYKNAVIIVCSIRYNEEICADLHNLGFTKKQIVPCCDRWRDVYRIESVSSFSTHLQGYEWAYNFFEDDSSKQLVLDKIRMLLCGIDLNPNTTSDCYYEDGFITLDNNEVFIDGGAFNGDTTEDFIYRFKGDMFHVHAFEPSKANYDKATARFGANPNISLVQKGLWSECTELVFSEMPTVLSGSSLVRREGCVVEYEVQVTSLDGYFEGRSNENLPTFIKMDIEGAEKEALIGAAKIIKKCKPKLAICAYHKTEDIYTLPKTILNIRNDYKFALRQHAYGKLDTMLYAV